MPLSAIDVKKVVAPDYYLAAAVQVRGSTLDVSMRPAKYLTDVDAFGLIHGIRYLYIESDVR